MTQKWQIRFGGVGKEMSWLWKGNPGHGRKDKWQSQPSDEKEAKVTSQENEDSLAKEEAQQSWEKEDSQVNEDEENQTMKESGGGKEKQEHMKQTENFHQDGRGKSIRVVKSRIC